MEKHYTIITTTKHLEFPEPIPTIQYDYPIGPDPQPTLTKGQKVMSVLRKTGKAALDARKQLHEVRDKIQEIREEYGIGGDPSVYDPFGGDNAYDPFAELPKKK